MKAKRMVRQSHLRSRSTQLLEQLEPRVLLSANVTASVTNGILTLKGDNSSHNVVIDQPTATQVRVSVGDTVTRINGQSAAQLFSNVTGISFSVTNGNDTIAINGTTLTGSVSITGATGNQVVTLANDNFGGNLTLTSNGAQNSTDVENTLVSGNLTVNLGAGYSSSQCGNWGGSTFSNANEIFTLGGSTVGNNVSITNASGETSTTLDNSTVVGNNLTITNGANSYGSFGFNSCCGSSSKSSGPSGDVVYLSNALIVNNVTISNASDGNNTDIENSAIFGALSVSNVVATSNQSNFGCSNSCNLSNASDTFTLNLSSIGTDVSLANISDGATASITDSTVSGNLTINNGVGTYGQGYTSCGGQNAANFGDYLVMTGSTVVSNATITNGSTYNSSDIESSTVGVNMSVSNGLNYITSSGGKTSNNCYNSCCGNFYNSQVVMTTDLFTLNGSTVGGNLAVANANGYTNTALNSSTVGMNVTISDAAGTAIFEMSMSTIGMNLTFTAGAGSTNATVTSSTIMNNATFNVAAGAVVVINPSEVVNALAIS